MKKIVLLLCLAFTLAAHGQQNYHYCNHHPNQQPVYGGVQVQGQFGIGLSPAPIVNNGYYNGYGYGQPQIQTRWCQRDQRWDYCWNTPVVVIPVRMVRYYPHPHYRHYRY